MLLRIILQADNQVVAWSKFLAKQIKELPDGSKITLADN